MEEQIDILDYDGNKTGKVVSKSMVHANGDWHRTVHVWFLNSRNQLLLQKRAHNKLMWPDSWDISAAGHISAGQTSVGAAVRETQEELGVKITEKDLQYLFTVRDEDSGNNGTYIERELNDVYLVRRDLNLNDLRFTDGEVSEVQYIDLEEFEKWVREKKVDLVPNTEEHYKIIEYIRKLGV